MQNLFAFGQIFFQKFAENPFWDLATVGGIGSCSRRKHKTINNYKLYLNILGPLKRGLLYCTVKVNKSAKRIIKL
jgi:hypothetical protein